LTEGCHYVPLAASLGVLELSWGEVDGAIVGGVDDRVFEIESWADGAIVSFGGWGVGCRVRERDPGAPAGCDGWSSTDPAPDLVLFYGSAPTTDAGLTVVEE
jgi:hypothetical protein